MSMIEPDEMQAIYDALRGSDEPPPMTLKGKLLLLAACAAIGAVIGAVLVSVSV